MSSVSESVTPCRENSFIVYNDFEYEEFTNNYLNDTLTRPSQNILNESSIDTKMELNNILEEVTNDFINFEPSLCDIIPIENNEFEYYTENLLKDESILKYEIKKSNAFIQQHEYNCDILMNYESLYQYSSSDNTTKCEKPQYDALAEEILPPYLEQLLINDGNGYDLSYLTNHSLKLNDKLHSLIEKYNNQNIGYFTAINSNRNHHIFIGTNTGYLIVIKYQTDIVNHLIDFHKIQLMYDKNFELPITSISLKTVTPHDSELYKDNADSTLSTTSYINNKNIKSSQFYTSLPSYISASNNKSPIDAENYKISDILYKKFESVGRYHFICVVYGNTIIAIWNVKMKKIIAKLEYGNSNDNRINQVTMYDKRSFYVSETNGNGVFVKFNHNYKSYQKILIYSSTVSHTRLSPLFFDVNHYKKLNQDPCIVAVSTATNIFVLALDQNRRNIYSSNLIKNLPNVFNFVQLQTIETKWYIKNLSNIILACISNVAIFFIYFEYQNGFHQKDLIIFPSKNTTGFQWISSESFLRIDQKEDLNIVIYRGEWMESKIISLSSLKISHNFKYSPYGCTYMDVCACLAPNYIAILGLEKLCVFSINDDYHRYDYFMSKNSHLEALLMIKSCYQRINHHGISNIQRPKELLQQKMIDCMEKYLLTLLEHIRCVSSGKPFYKKFLKILWAIVLYFSTIKEFKLACLTLLMSKIYQQYIRDTTERNSFLEMILNYVVKQKKIDHVPSLLFNDIKNYLVVSRRIFKFEHFIMNLENFSTKHDDPIFTTLLSHSLYKAYLHLYNFGLNEYILPLNNLSYILRNSINQGSHITSYQFEEIINAIMENINSNLTAISNHINDNNIKRMEHTCDFLLQKEINTDLRRSEFEILRFLMKYRFETLFDIFTVSFSQSISVVGETIHRQLHRRKNEIINAVANIMASHNDFNDNERSLFYLFLGREIVHNPASIQINKAIFNRLFHYLTLPSLERSIDKEIVLLKLFESNHFINFNEYSKCNEQKMEKESFYTLPTVITMVKKCQYYKLLALIYQKSRQYENLIELYLFLSKSNYEKEYDMFEELKNVFNSITHKSDSEIYMLKMAIETYLKDIIIVDVICALYFIVEYFPSLLERVFYHYNEQSDTYYIILDHLFTHIDGYQGIVVADILKNVHEDQLKFMEYACHHQNECYLENYIKNYKIYVQQEKLVLLFQKYNFQHCLIYMYEKMEKYEELACLHKNMIISKLTKLGSILNEVTTCDNYCNEWISTIHEIDSNLQNFFKFYSKKFHVFNTNYTWTIWSNILEQCLSLLYINSNINNNQDNQFINDIGNFCKIIFEQMTKYVSIFLVMQRILQKQSLYRTIIPRLSIMFTNLTLQKGLNRTRFQLSNKIASSEVITLLRRYIQTSKKAFICDIKKCCSICKKIYINLDKNQISTHDMTYWQLNNNNNRQQQLTTNPYILLFECGHWEHENCIRKHYNNIIDNSENDDLSFIFCSKCRIYSPNIFTASNQKESSVHHHHHIHSIFMNNTVNYHSSVYSHTDNNKNLYYFNREMEYLKKINTNINKMYNNFIE